MRVFAEEAHWGRRGAVAGLAFAGVLSSALPAFAHASFPSSAALGFQPNPTGGSGAAGVAPPYAANTAVTIWARVPYEQTEPFNGNDDTNVDVKVIVPAGWTNASCGAAKTNKADASTNNTNQPGADVTGWSCAVETANNHTVLHWHGPQVVAPATAFDSAQFFAVNVKTPSPTAQTTYNGAAGSGTEGFIIDQTYASGEQEHWIPNADYPGTPPAGVTGVVATGLVRTVAAVGVTPPPPPPSAGGTQTISATVGAATEEFTMTIPSNPGINMTAGAQGANFPFTGTLNAIVLRDTRSAKPAWSVSGQISNFSPNNVNGKYLGWTPKVLSAGAGAVAGASVASGIDGVSNGLRTSSTLASAPAGHAIGQASLGADLDLRLPLDTPAGSYTATLTITAI